MAWKSLVTLRKNTQDGAGWCLRYAQSFVGAPAMHPSAWAAWTAVAGKHGPGEALPPVPVPLWFSHYGTYGSPAFYANWGHVAWYVPGDAIYTSPAGGYGYGRYATIAQIEQVFNAKYVGWSEYLNGMRVAINEAPAPLLPTQRKVGKEPVKRRSGPGTNFKEKSPMLKAGEIGNFKGWTKGESVDGNNIWFVGVSGDCFWSKAFLNPKTTGLPDLTAQYKPGWRVTAKEPVNRRTGPGLNYPLKEPMLKPNTGYEFIGFAKINPVDGNNLWYKSKGGDWFSSVGFTTKVTTGLKDLTNDFKPKLKANQRMSKGEPVNARAKASTKSGIVGSLAANSVIDFTQWVTGENIGGNNLWYKKDNKYFWSGAFTASTKDGLTEFKETLPPVKPPVEEDKEWHYIAPSIKPLDTSTAPDWIKIDVVLDNDIQGFSAEIHNTKHAVYYDEKYGYNRNYQPIEAHLHDWGDPNDGATHDSVVNYLRNTEDLSVNFVVSAGRITIMMPLDYNAMTTGPRNLWGWKMEIDPGLTDEVYATVAWLVYEIERQNPYLKGEALRRHLEFMATLCSPIDVDRVRLEADLYLTSNPTPPENNNGYEKVKVPLKIVENKDGSFSSYVEVLQPK